MNIFVVAPDHHDLPNASAEIAAISSFHWTKILRGNVRDDDIRSRLQELDEAGFEIEIFWWITHGSPAGVLLSDGMLSTAGVGQYLRVSGARLCVLNTCESEDVALEIVAGGKADIICTIAPVDNRDAIRLGALLAGELAHTSGFYEAYEAVAPDGGLYRYLRSGRQYRRRENGGVTLDDIWQVLAGDRFGQPGLVNRVTAVEQRLGKVEQRMGEVETELVDLKSLITERFERGRVTMTPPVAAAMIAVMILLALSLVVLLVLNARGGSLDGQFGAAVCALLCF